MLNGGYWANWIWYHLNCLTVAEVDCVTDNESGPGIFDRHHAIHGLQDSFAILGFLLAFLSKLEWTDV